MQTFSAAREMKRKMRQEQLFAENQCFICLHPQCKTKEKFCHHREKEHIYHGSNAPKPEQKGFYKQKVSECVQSLSKTER